MHVRRGGGGSASSQWRGGGKRIVGGGRFAGAWQWRQLDSGYDGEVRKELGAKGSEGGFGNREVVAK
jgi:hypothetical protein